MAAIAIITARGGSKRIPRKNIKLFLGKPIIKYSIEAALESKLFEEVMVSTEDCEIAQIAQNNGAKVPFMRSVKNADDFSDTTDVLCEVLEEYRKRGKMFDIFCCIYPTAPFVTPYKLKESYRLLQDEDVYNVVSMVPFSFPPQRALKQEGRFLLPVQAEYIEARSQDLQQQYHDCGQFYWAKTEEFLKTKNLLYNHTRPYIISEMEMQDIDNEVDWDLAEIKYYKMKEKNT